MRFGRLFLLAVVATAFLTGTVRADFVFEFGTTAGTAVPNGTIVPVTPGGGTVTLNLYLRESVGGTILSTQGLFTASFQVAYSNPAVAAVTAASKGPAFTNTFAGNISIGPTATTVPEATQFNAFAFPDASNRVLLGTFTFTGGTAGTSNITVQVFQPPAFQTGTNANIDSQINQGFITLSTVGVPEPTSLILSGLGATGFVSAWLRRRTRSHSEAAVATS
jgi:hypothetical protein